MKKLLPYIAMSLFFFSFVSAFPCEWTIDENYCEQIEPDNLLYSSLLYQDTAKPNHAFIKNYNKDITVTQPPNDAIEGSSKFIKNAWLSLLFVSPSVLENQTIYVPNQITAKSWYDYMVVLPENYESPGYPSTSQGDCKRRYYLDERKDTINYFHNDLFKGYKRESTFSIGQSGTLNSFLYITARARISHYEWETYCCAWKKGECKKYCHECNYDRTTYEDDSLFLADSIDLELYAPKPGIGVIFTNNYYDTLKGTYLTNEVSGYQIDMGDSQIKGSKHYFDVVFNKSPYYFATIRAHNFSSIEHTNLILSNNTFYVSESTQCELYAYNYFYETAPLCNLKIYQESVEPLTTSKKSIDFSLLLKISIMLLILYIFYRCLESQYKKAILPLVFLATLPHAFADECGLTNLGSCLPEKMYDFLLLVINAPLLPTLEAIKALLTADISIGLFQHTWSVMRYILSFFYLFFFVYAGYIFLTSGGNPIKRGHAKDMLKNAVFMIIIIQSSYYIYDLALSLMASLNTSILGMIDPHFFLLTIDNIPNIGLEFLSVFFYMLTIFFTLLLLIIRYIVVSFGVVLFPFGVFLYFIPPLKGYGKFILHLLGVFIFVSFIDLLIILACSILIQEQLFANIKILVMITCFLIVNYTLYLTIKFAMNHSIDSSIKDDLNQAVKFVTMVI